MSRRFKSKLHRVQAQPDALPEAPLVLDDSNSFVDVTQPDVRKPLQLHARQYVTAESTLAADKIAAENLAAAEAAAAAEAGA